MTNATGINVTDATSELDRLGYSTWLDEGDDPALYSEIERLLSLFAD
jgi:hypothetical protein